MVRVKVSVSWFINCGCGFTTTSLKSAVEHVKQSKHVMGGKVVVRPRK